MPKYIWSSCLHCSSQLTHRRAWDGTKRHPLVLNYIQNRVAYTIVMVKSVIVLLRKKKWCWILRPVNKYWHLNTSLLALSLLIRNMSLAVNLANPTTHANADYEASGVWCCCIMDEIGVSLFSLSFNFIVYIKGFCIFSNRCTAL